MEGPLGVITKIPGTATNGVILNSCIPVMIIAMAWIFFRERLSALQLVGVAVSLCGVLAILSFAIGMVLLVRYAASPAAAARFTAMAFLVSYTVASLGPTTMGALRDLSGAYSTIWLVLAGLMVVQIGAALVLHPARAPVR